jgi:MoaA/NifB/PqqE/SkfB family radical SAM enzyme
MNYLLISHLASITTHGHPINEDSLDRLKAAGLTDLVVSIDSADKKIHDQYR